VEGVCVGSLLQIQHWILFSIKENVHGKHGAHNDPLSLESNIHVCRCCNIIILYTSYWPSRNKMEDDRTFLQFYKLIENHLNIWECRNIRRVALGYRRHMARITAVSKPLRLQKHTDTHLLWYLFQTSLMDPLSSLDEKLCINSGFKFYYAPFVYWCIKWSHDDVNTTSRPSMHNCVVSTLFIYPKTIILWSVYVCKTPFVLSQLCQKCRKRTITVRLFKAQ
jgi:hypothetical protein